MTTRRDRHSEDEASRQPSTPDPTVRPAHDPPPPLAWHESRILRVPLDPDEQRERGEMLAAAIRRRNALEESHKTHKGPHERRDGRG